MTRAKLPMRRRTEQIKFRCRGRSFTKLFGGSEMKIYLAGPMTGIPHFNFPAFKATAALLRAEGHEVFSPAEHDIETHGESFHTDNSEGDTKKAESNGFSLRGALRADLDWICDHAEGIYMMHGWENSKGARTEHALAVTLGLKVIYA